MNPYQRTKKIFYLSKVKNFKMISVNRTWLSSFLKFFKFFTIVTCLFLILSYLSPFFHPDTFIYLAFVGLAYPVIIFFTILFGIIWYFIDPKWSFIILLVIIAGGSLHFRFFSPTIFEDEPKDNSIHLMSYNVRLFDIYNPDFQKAKQTRNNILKLIRQENPDILCLQEYYRQDLSQRFITKDSLIAIVGSYNYEMCTYNPRGSQHFGVATFSKFPIINSGFVNLNVSSQLSYNYCIYTDVVKKLDTIRIYNTHLESIKLFDKYYEQKRKILFNKKNVKRGYNKLSKAYSKRANQAIEIMKHVSTSPYPVIICGDFNDTPFSYTYNVFNRSLVDAFRNTSFGIGATYLGKLPAGRIDYIFHSKELNSNNFNIMDKPLSDHCAISCLISK